MSRLLLPLSLALLLAGCASSGRGIRTEPPSQAGTAQAGPGDAFFEEQVFRTYALRLDAPGNPIRNVTGSPEHMSPKAFRKWAILHDRKVTAWERRQAQVVARRFKVTADEVIRIYCAVAALHFTEGSRQTPERAR